MNKTENSIPDGVLVPLIQKAWGELQKYLIQQRRDLGSRYNWRNPYEQIDRRFGRAGTEVGARAYLEEFKLIVNKSSNQPASVRQVITDICQRALSLYLIEKAQEKKPSEKPAPKKKGGKDADRKS